MVSNKKFSKVFDIVSNFEKKSSSFLSLRKKQAQDVSTVESEVSLKRDIEELMTKGVNSTVRPYWQTLVSAVNGLKKVGKLPGNLEALDYYQVIVHGGVAFARRVAFASKFPQVISLLAVECQKENILDAKQRGQLTSLSQALNEPCEMIKSKYDSLVKAQEKTKSTFDERIVLG